MKKYIIILLVCFLGSFANAQKISEYTSYVEAMKATNTSEEKLMMIYFTDGNNSKTDRTIKKEILKSNVLKQLGKDVIILKIDRSKKPQLGAYNGRPTQAYNSNKIYPSVKVYIPGHGKNLPLQTDFSDTEINNFLNAIKTL